jgi:hypothetical protein
MKKIVTEEQGEGLEKLLGEYVTLYCSSFIYAGILKGVDAKCALLENASIVYDTGTHADESWQTAEEMPGDWYVMLTSVESFGVFKNGK